MSHFTFMGGLASSRRMRIVMSPAPAGCDRLKGRFAFPKPWTLCAVGSLVVTVSDWPVRMP
jgi:hypothetical protein